MKKFKLMAIALLSSAVALSSCMLLPKKKGSSSSTEPTSGTSTSGGSGSNSGSQTPTPTPTDWSDEVKADMKEALDNEVLPFFSGTWEWSIDEEGTLTGVSEDATLSNVKSKLSGWEIETTSYYGYFDYDVALKLHTNSGVFLQIFEGEEAGIEMYGYYVPEKTAWSETEKSTMVSVFGEEFPFPGGQWSDITVDAGEEGYPDEYWIQTTRSYNEASIDQVLRSKGYESTVIPATEDYDAYTLYEKTSSKGYIQAYIDPSLFTNSGYVTFYLSDTSALVDETFELTSDKTKYLKGDSGTLTLTVGADVPAGEVAYTVAPEGSATVTKTETGATFVISNELTQDTEITFTATQGDFVATCKVMAYHEEIPTDVTDVLTMTSFTTESTTTYADHSYTSADSGVKYDAQCASDKNSIQIRSKNSNSGIIANGGDKKCVSIKVDYTYDETGAARTIDIYASNTAFTIADMYGTTVTKLASLNTGDTYTFTDSYKYVGVRSSNGAIYISSIEFVWAD